MSDQAATSAPAEFQPALFSFFGLELINREKPEWHSTGKLLRKHRPEIYRLAVELVGAGRHSKREVCKLLHMSAHTLESVEIEESENLATLRQKAARENMVLHRMALERAAELIPDCTDLAKVAIASGIFAEKTQLFAGEATARITGTEPVDLVERFGQFVSALEKRVTAREIGLAEKNTATNAPGLPAPADLPVIEAETGPTPPDSSCIERLEVQTDSKTGVQTEALTKTPNRLTSDNENHTNTE